MPKVKLSDISFKAIIAGALVDNLGTMFSVSLLILGLSSAGLSEPEVTERLKTLSGLLLTLIVGLGWTMMGGYTAGRVAKRSEILHAALAAVISIAVGLIFREAGRPDWSEIAGLVCMLPVGMAGGLLAQKRRLPSRK